VSRLLALETATSVASVALLVDGGLVAEHTADSSEDHAATLLPTIESLLDQAGVAPDEIDAFALSIGPGSFTCLRIGLATVKGLAFGSDRPVAAVSTLAALAWSTGHEGVLVPLLDARRGEVYAGVYERKGDILQERLGDGCYRAEQLAELVRPPLLLVGEGAPLVAPLLERRLGSDVVREPGAPRRPKAAAVAALGARCLEAGDGVAAHQLVPRYVRRPEAEVLRTRRRFEGSA